MFEGCLQLKYQTDKKSRQKSKNDPNQLMTETLMQLLMKLGDSFNWFEASKSTDFSFLNGQPAAPPFATPNVRKE